MPKMPTIKTYKKRAWNLVSEYVRKESLGICFTCGEKKEWNKMHCGHYIHGKLDYDLRNLKAQCPRCNRFLHGNLGVYAEKLIEIYGLNWIKKLRLDSENEKKYTIDDLKLIISKFENSLFNL